MRRELASAALLALAGCGGGGDKGAAPESPAASAAPSPTASPTPVALAKPDLAKCPRYDPAERAEMERPRGRPLAIPAKYAAYVAADRDHVAVATLTGATLCVDARYQESAQDFRDFADGRFFGYAWFGYEANGFQLFDRAGKGTAIDTGAEPVFSPAGKRFGSVEWSESGFGALNAVLVMQVLPDGLKELARFEQLPERTSDWRLDRWRGEDCFEVSAVAPEDYPESGEITAKTPRQRFAVARGAGGWKMTPSTKGCPAG